MTDSLLQPTFFVTGGTLPLSAASYLERAADKELLSALLAGEYCFVLNARQMGKSSLAVRTLQKLSEQGIRTVFLDLQKFGGANVTPDQWYLALLAEVGRVVNLRREMLAYWKAQEAYPLVRRFFGALREVVLEQIPGPVVILIDEIDAVRSLPFATDEFFSALRECYNARVQDATYQRLTFCLVGSVLPADLIQDRRTSPFNVGQRIELKDFALEEIAPLAEGLQRENAPALVQRIFHWTHGHPYLTQSLCAEIAARREVHRPAQVDPVVAELFFEAKAKERNVNLADVANRMLSMPGVGADADELRAQVLDLYGKMHRGQPVADDEADRRAGILKLSGVTRTEDGQLKVRNRIYETVFDRKWIQKQMPDAELRRQQTAYRRGLLRAVTVSALVVLIIGGLAWKALRLAQEQETARLRTQRMLYVSDMNVAGQAVTEGDLGRARAILEAHRPKPGEADLRGFEWRLLWSLSQDQSRDTFPRYRPPSVFVSIAFSPDGRFLASAEGDGMIQVWDRHSRRKAAVLQGPTEGVLAVAFSPDGRRLASGSSDNSVKLWDVPTGRLLMNAQGHRDFVTAVTFSPDGRRLASAGYDGAVRLWHTAGRRGLYTLPIGHRGGVNGVAFSPDGRYLATCGEDAAARLWDLATRRVVAVLRGHKEGVPCLAFSPDGRVLATGSWDKTVRLWKVETRRAIAVLPHRGAVFGVGFSPDGQALASGDAFGTVRMWDVGTRHESAILLGHTGAVGVVAFSPDGSTLATGGAEGALKLWDIPPRQTESAVTAQSDQVSTVAYAPDGQLVATGGYAGLRLWDGQTGRLLSTLRGRLTYTLPVFSPDGRTIAAYSVSTDRVIELWDVRRRRLTGVLGGHTRLAVCVAFSPDGRLLATGGTDQTVRLWDAATRRAIAVLKQPAGVTAVQFSPDGQMFATGDSSGKVRLWEVHTLQEVAALDSQPGACLLAFSPDGRLLAAGMGASDSTVRLWDVKHRRQLLPPLIGQRGQIGGLAFSPDGQTLATASGDGTVRLWSVATHQQLTALKADGYGVAFSPDGNTLATGGAGPKLQGTVKLWRAAPFAETDRKAGQP